MPYYRHDVSGVTPEMSHTRIVEWKIISVGRVIVRYANSNQPSKEIDKQTSRKFGTLNSCIIIDYSCMWVTGEEIRRP
jgi:hypothetical protein